MPGRGCKGTPGDGGRLNFAAKSGRGGTTGRAAGWPARFGFAGGRKGPPPVLMVCGAPGPLCAAVGAPGPGADGGTYGGRGAGRAGDGAIGMLGSRGAAGAAGLGP